MPYCEFPQHLGRSQNKALPVLIALLQNSATHVEAWRAPLRPHNGREAKATDWSGKERRTISPEGGGRFEPGVFPPLPCVSIGTSVQ